MDENEHQNSIRSATPESLARLLDVALSDSALAALTGGSTEAHTPLDAGPRYRLLRLIGAGGMGLVYLARDTQSGEQVAIKFLKPELKVNPQALRRFKKEVVHMQRLRCPQFVPVIEINTAAETPHFVMPFLAAGSLAHQMVDAKPLPRERILSIALDVARALAFAHSRGIIHRDLKPANILLDAEGHALVSDFGLARTLFNDSLMDVASGHAEGTPAYMSPALAAGQQEDTRGDIYAFGALLYEMLTGRPPYEGTTSAAILEQIRAAPPTEIRRVNPAADESLALIAETAMARELRDRYSSMNDVLADLEAVREGKSPRNATRAQRPLFLIWKFRSVRIAAVAIALPMVLAFALLLRDKPPPMKETQLRTNETAAVETREPDPDPGSPHRMRIATWDDLGAPKKLFTLGRTWRVSTLDDQTVNWGTVTGSIRSELSVEVLRGHEGSEHAFAHWQAEDGASIIRLNPNSNNHQGWRSQYLYPSAVVWRTNDGKIETKFTGLEPQLVTTNDAGLEILLASVRTSFVPPRGLACFDFKSGGSNWFFPTAPMPKGVISFNLGSDGRPGFVLGSDSVSNGVTLTNGMGVITSDTNCYVYGVSHDGKERWRYDAGGFHHWASPLKCASTQSPRLFAAVTALSHVIETNRTNWSTVGRIVELNPANGLMKNSNDLGSEITSARSLDVDGDGTEEIVVADRKGRIHLLTPELNSRATNVLTEQSEKAMETHIIGPIHRPGGTNLLVVLTAEIRFNGRPAPGNHPDQKGGNSFHKPRVLLLDAELQPAGRCELSTEPSKLNCRVELADSDGDGWEEIFLITQKVKTMLDPFCLQN